MKQGGKYLIHSFFLPEDEVKVGECQHDEAEERRKGTVQDGAEHVAEGDEDAAVLVADARQEAL